MKMNEWIKNNRWKVLGTILLVSLFLAIYVTGVQKVNRLMAQNRELERKIQSIDYENQEYRYQITNLESPDRINNIAVKKLNMIKPTEVPKILK